mgnify:CR=1 FL=1
MPVPFLQKHSEQQYLYLETFALNLFTAVQSLMTITEGEDLDSDNQKINHFGALCIRINQIVEEYAPQVQKVRGVMFKGDSATTNSPLAQPSGNVQIRVNKREYGHIIEGLEHFANMYPDSKVADEFQQVADDLKDLK